MWKMDIDDNAAATAKPPLSSAPQEPELPIALSLAMQLTFAMLLHTLRHPFHQPSEYATPTLNSYNTIILTFLTSILREPSVRVALECAVPWEELAVFFTNIPHRNITRKHHKVSAEHDLLFMSGGKPLPQDWCIRGMGWGGKKVFKRGFWNKDADTAGEEHNIEVEVLDRMDIPDQAMDGIIEDERDEREALANDQSPEKRHWVRLARAGLHMARDVRGFEFVAVALVDGWPCWRVEGALAKKVAQWRAEEQREREVEEQHLRGTWWGNDSMEVDDVEGLADEESSDDEDADTEEIRKLKVSCLGYMLFNVR